MNPEIKAQWVSALREPGRVQGKGILRDKDGAQCCLDVLCELGVKAGVLPAPVLATQFTEYPVFAYTDTEDNTLYRMVDGEKIDSDLQWEVLPTQIMRWAGLADKNPMVIYGDDDDETELAWLNDQEELTFVHIADIIEASDL